MKVYFKQTVKKKKHENGNNVKINNKMFLSDEGPTFETLDFTIGLYRLHYSICKNKIGTVLCFSVQVHMMYLLFSAEWQEPTKTTECFNKIYNNACTLPEYVSKGINNRFKSVLDMRDNRKCITISLSTSIWSHCFMGIEESLGSVFSNSKIRIPKSF